MTELSAVRGAVPEDEAAILDLCFSLHDENGMWGLNRPKVAEFIHCGVHKVVTPAVPIFPTIGVVGAVGRPEGAICFSLMQPWYSDDWILSEFFNYVHPDYRQSRHADALIHFAKDCADKMSLPLSIGIMSNHRTQAKIRIYRRALGEPSGAYFIHSPSVVKQAVEAA